MPLPQPAAFWLLCENVYRDIAGIDRKLVVTIPRSLRAFQHYRATAMAEPVNTPMPPGTPISATPRSTSPAPPPPPLPAIFPPITPRSSSYSTPAPKSAVLYLGDPVKHNPDAGIVTLLSLYNILQPSAAERQRPEFTQALREKRWGDFSAVVRPSWTTGGEMGRWDEELISLLPASVVVFASAGTQFDNWVDAKLLARRGIVYCDGGPAAAKAVADHGRVQDTISTPTPENSERDAELEELTLQNVTAVLEGKEPITPVNLQWLERK